MTERMSEARFRETFTERSPSLEAWLTKWLSKSDAARKKPSAEERWARMAARAQTPEGQAHQLRETYGYLAQMSAEDQPSGALTSSTRNSKPRCRTTSSMTSR